MATLTKQQQIDIFKQGKQLNPKDVTVNAFLQDGSIDLSKVDPKIAAQKNCFQPDGFFDERDTTAMAFVIPMTEEDYNRIPENVRKQLEQFTGSFEPSHSSAMDFIEEN